MIDKKATIQSEVSCNCYIMKDEGIHFNTFCIQRFTLHFLGKNACGRKAFLKTASNEDYFHFMNFYFQDFSFVFIVIFIIRDLRYIYLVIFFVGIDVL